jgi:hypothetical protein
VKAGRGTIKTHFRNIFKLVFFHKLELSKINKMKHISVLEVVYYAPMTQSNINFCVYHIPISRFRSRLCFTNSWF